MAPIKGCDYAFGRPSPAALRAAGIVFVGRYVTGGDSDPAKALTLAEARELAAAGLMIYSLWETTTSRALAGRAAGVIDAGLAAADAAAAGARDGDVIYFAVDEDLKPALVLAYFEGIASVRGAWRTGVYGSEAVIAAVTGAGYARYGARSASTAWSGGTGTVGVTIVQGPPMQIDGVTVDRNEALAADYGGWQPDPHQGDDVSYNFDVRPINPAEAASKSVGTVAWPEGAAHSIELTGDPGFFGAAGWQVRIALHLSSGPDVVMEDIVAPADKVIFDFPEHAPDAYGATVTAEIPVYVGGIAL